MLYWLLYEQLYPAIGPFRVFRFLTVRTLFASLTSLILGVILVAFVLLVPKGLVPTLADFAQSLLRLRRRRNKRGFEPQQAE